MKNRFLNKGQGNLESKLGCNRTAGHNQEKMRIGLVHVGHQLSRLKLLTHQVLITGIYQNLYRISLSLKKTAGWKKLELSSLSLKKNHRMKKLELSLSDIMKDIKHAYCKQEWLC
nr:unnamed protein product [Callosobruchus chinensis]